MHAETPVTVRPRVLLIEDDAAIRQFVGMALEEHDLDLIECPTLGAARRALVTAPAALVLLDMMLPDGSGLDLLRDTELRRAAGPARWVIFSAGLSPAIGAQLASLDVDRLLHKPVSLAALCDCVDEALRAAAQTQPDAAASAAPATASAAHLASDSLEPPDGSEAAQAQAVAIYFEGDRALFGQMRQRAATQFLHDAAAGDAALAAGDLRALRRVAHSLKTILRMLAYPQASERARELEQVLAAGKQDHWPRLWASLRQDIVEIADTAT